MNPTLRKLSDSRLSAVEYAALLEKHIGSGFNDVHCLEALAALERIRKTSPAVVAPVLARLVQGSDAPCETVKLVIAKLRQND